VEREVCAPPEVLAACRQLKIDPGALWYYRVRRGQHVIIVLANGEKFTVDWGDLPAPEPQVDLSPPPETTLPQ
jgi:hypothetical protein